MSNSDSTGRRLDPNPPSFEVGAAVRVRRGVNDPDYPDIPLGGWAGVVGDINPASQPPLYLVEWTAETLQEAHPVYRHRCDRDDLDGDGTWLPADQLEADDGTPLELAKPTRLRPKPLDLDQPADLVRQTLGLTSDDPLPGLDRKHLLHFKKQFERRVKFPFPVLLGPSSDHALGMVLRILRAPKSTSAGLVAEVVAGTETTRLPLEALCCPESEPAAKLIAAYATWLESSSWASDEPNTLLTAGTARAILANWLGGCVWLGGVSGALLATAEEAFFAALVSAAILGSVASWIGSKLVRVVLGGQPHVEGVRSGFLIGGLLGTAAGFALGPVLAGYLGTVPGAIVGSVLGLALGKRSFGELRWTVLGAGIGGLALAWSVDGHRTLVGFVLGGVVGGVTCLGLSMFGVYLAFAADQPSPTGGEDRE